MEPEIQEPEHLKTEPTVSTIWNSDYFYRIQLVATVLDAILDFYHLKTDLQKFWI